MALQINVPLTTNSGLTVPSGSYCWLLADFGNDLEYKVRVKMLFFKNKASFDARQSRFDPVQIPVDQYSQDFTPTQIGAVDYLDIHNFVKAQLEAILGANTVAVAQ